MDNGDGHLAPAHPPHRNHAVRRFFNRFEIRVISAPPYCPLYNLVEQTYILQSKGQHQVVALWKSHDEQDRFD